MLVSVLMPTVNPLQGLVKAIDSICSTASDVSHVEILLRIDEENPKRIDDAERLKNKFPIRTVIGPRGSGYLNMGAFVTSLLDIAKGQWSWLFDDDAFVTGNWQKQLAAIPCDPVNGPAVQSETYQLGPSKYGHGHPVGLIVPTAFAKTVPLGAIADQPWLDEIKKRGWKIETLKGVSYCHDGRPR